MFWIRNYEGVLLLKECSWISVAVLFDVVLRFRMGKYCIFTFILGCDWECRLIYFILIVFDSSKGPVTGLLEINALIFMFFFFTNHYIVMQEK